MRRSFIRSIVYTAALGWLGLLAATGHAHGTADTGTADSARAITFPDVGEYKTLVTDLHTHSVFSDGHVWPKIRVEEALRDGLHVMAVTEHLEYQPHRADLPNPDRNKAYEETREAAQDSNLLIVAGSEITREFPSGHMNALFISDANKLFKVDTPPADPADAIEYYKAANAWPAQEAVDAANAQGAFVFWNHPYWTRQKPDAIARITDFHKANASAGKLHGIEIANGHDYSAESFAIALKHNLTLIGVSDVHDLVDWDYPPAQGAHRPVTLVFATARSADAVREALFARRTVVWFKNHLFGREAQLRPLVEASLSISRAAYRQDTEVLDVTFSNRSDVVFELHNKSKITMMGAPDRFTVAANGTTTVSFKPGAIQPTTDLSLEVENALTAPDKHLKLHMRAAAQGVQ